MPEPPDYGWDEVTKSFVAKRVGDWIVSVAPQLFDDLVMLTHRSQWPREWVAAWYYDQGDGLPAAEVWDPVADQEPAGFTRLFRDARANWVPGETLTASEFFLRGDNRP